LTTTIYLRKGRARPYHVAGDDGKTAVCGAIRRGDGDVHSMAVAPEPLSAVQVCAVCLAIASHSADHEARPVTGLPIDENSDSSDLPYVWSIA
jgi:hypothetical protein